MSGTIPTHAELMAFAEQLALARTSKLNERSFDPGFIPNILLGSAAALAEEAIQRALALHRLTFFATASGDDLDVLASDHFSLDRQPGVAAIGEVTFDRPNTIAGNILIPAGTQLSAPADGIGFVTTQELLMTTTTIDSTVAAQVTGDTGNVGINTITTIVDVLDDPTITVTNAAIMAGGTAAETDTAFRDRIRNYLATVRRGTIAALEFGAKSVAGVAEAVVDESTDPITVYIADVTGASNAALQALVFTELDNWRAAGIQVNVLGASVVAQAVALTVTFQAGFDTALVRDEIRTAVVAAVNAVTIGETLFRSKIITAASNVTGIDDVVVTNPAGDVAPDADELIRTTSETVTF